VLGQGWWLQILITFLTACVAVAALAAAFGGWMLRQCTLLERILLGLAGCSLLYADLRLDLLGTALLLIGVALHGVRVRRMRAPVGAAP